ncbi:MAG: hypothetical protein IPG18_07710 [Saprospiraceae bacterium]|nr:hypothetical protein [Saprospiraceae bacterium]
MESLILQANGYGIYLADTLNNYGTVFVQTVLKGYTDGGGKFDLYPDNRKTI